MKQQPEYVFGLQHYNPRQGFFIPFYMHFLELWDEPCHPQYDFETGELLYRDALGNETRRVPLVPGDPGSLSPDAIPGQQSRPMETRHEALPA